MSASLSFGRKARALQPVTRLFPRRRFLFLQGVPGIFLHALGEALARRGHGVLRVNFNGGDRVDWPRLPAEDFRGRIADWPAFLQRLILDRDPTDIVLHGDCRPLHRIAIEIANRHGIAVHVFEEGYLRPDWVTLEVGGVNGYSRLPRDASAYRAAAAMLPPLPDARHAPPSLRARVPDCLSYAVASLALRPLYPHFVTHRGWTLLREGYGWLNRSARWPFATRRSAAAVNRVLAAPGGFFVLPIQMDNDSQILCHSGLGGMMHAIRLVVASFARHAPAGTMLAVKVHPLDNSVIDWGSVTRDAAAAAGVADRVVLIEACDLRHLLSGALGMVTVNSTSATLAMSMRVPVIALGDAVYDLAGLTHPCGLETFWAAPSPPDPALYEAFRRVLAYACLIPGDFFTPGGVRQAVAEAVPRIEAALDAAQRIDALRLAPVSARAV